MWTFRSAVLVPMALVVVAALLLFPGLIDTAKRQAAGAMASLETLRQGTGKGGNATPADPQNQPGNAIAVSFASARSGSFPVVTRTFGTVQSPAVVEVGARISSQVTQIHVKDGQMVKAGDLLISLDDRALRAQLARDQATLARDDALVVSTTADLNRAKDLASKQAGTLQAYDTALALQRGAQANADGDQAAIDADQVQLDYTLIKAPISGRLGAVQVAVGDIVGTSSGTSNTVVGLVAITQMDPLQVTFHLAESELSTFRELLGAGNAPTVKALEGGGSEVVASGTLDFIDSAVDTASGTIAMRATFPNGNQVLWPGQYVDVEIARPDLPNATIIPTVALQSGQQGQFVWLVRPDDTVELRQVKVAASEGAASAIASGLDPGEHVVTDGQLRLKSGAAVRPTEAASAGDSAPPPESAAYAAPQGSPGRKQ
ncbi:efflux RND transporter periplasmic adaptor subunit [Aminobacter sp. AP02]|uniref:efflux RND transporter periplasmic adaptor subunit n=1 Tax=Aminobacter sp. AP02 TaxID=2135737 RepID=UPI000D6C2014|nr:efflux RND transporter periplasmic adaptor subunit [Aminobacter sp. AP02]PWK63739.1 multidrug efflux system membrane fusion protein [Aminobacter sp. AP02]